MSLPIRAASILPLVILEAAKSGISEAASVVPEVATPFVLIVILVYVPALIPLVEVDKFPEPSTDNPPPDVICTAPFADVVAIGRSLATRAVAAVICPVL